MLGSRQVWLGIAFLVLSTPRSQHFRLTFLPSNRGSGRVYQRTKNPRSTMVISGERGLPDVRFTLNIQYYYPQQQPYPQQYYPPPPGYAYQPPPYGTYQAPNAQPPAKYCATGAGICQLAPSLILPRGSQCSCGFPNGIFFGIAQ